ncbi:MAG: D-alanyl-D-alanine endopeptidase [Burkholderiales bacterium]|nr:D-alanyl-D-alanine endopeptidase [Burkholderiales bacterium]
MKILIVLCAVSGLLLSGSANAAHHHHRHHKAHFVKASYKDPHGFHSAAQPRLASYAAVIYDEKNGEELYAKNNDAVVPIASITKLMTAMVMLDAQLPMDEVLRIDDEDVDNLRHSSSRLPVGTRLKRSEMLRLALMSSENRAAAALGYNYPGGIEAFVRKMNEKAKELGMEHTHFVDSSGLHSENVSTAADLVRMVEAAYQYREIREDTTTSTHEVMLPRSERVLQYNNSNALVKYKASNDWHIGLSKTGFTNDAGHCLVMHSTIAEKPVVIVLLDSMGSETRIGDANRIRKWLESRANSRKDFS